MDNLQFTQKLPFISENELEEVETLLGFQLPFSYRTFILEFNGGIPNKLYFGNPQKMGHKFEIEFFYGFHLTSDITIRSLSTEFEPQFNILHLTQNKLEHCSNKPLGCYKKFPVFFRFRIEKIPSTLMVIGENSMGDYFFMSTSEEDFGYIYRYKHDDPEFWDEHDEFIYESLTPFIKDFNDIISYSYSQIYNYPNDQ